MIIVYKDEEEFRHSSSLQNIVDIFKDDMGVSFAIKTLANEGYEFYDGVLQTDIVNRLAEYNLRALIFINYNQYMEIYDDGLAIIHLSELRQFSMQMQSNIRHYLAEIDDQQPKNKVIFQHRMFLIYPEGGEQIG